MNASMITAALGAAGTLSVEQRFPGKHIFAARMSWPGELDVKGDISTSVEGAIENLEKALVDDAATEMQKSGAA